MTTRDATDLGNNIEVLRQCADKFMHMNLALKTVLVAIRDAREKHPDMSPDELVSFMERCAKAGLSGWKNKRRHSPELVTPSP